MARLGLAISVALMVAGCGGGGDSIIPAANAQTLPPPPATSSAPTVAHLHFILRPDKGGKWYIQKDGGHMPAGVVPEIVQTSTHLRVNFIHSWKYAGTIQITSDDDFGQVIAGHGNLGLTATEIKISANGTVIDPATVWNYLPGATGGNLWVNVTMID